MRIAVIHQFVPPSAPIPEQNTLEQVNSISRVLKGLGHEVTVLEFSLNIEKFVKEISDRKIEKVFNLVESFLGRDSNKLIVPIVLDQLKIPYTGSGLRALYLDNDKMSSKIMMHQAGIPTPDWWDERGGEEPQGIYIVKSVTEDCSLGIDGDSVLEVDSKEQLLKKINEKKKIFGGQWFAEKFIDGREFNVSILEVNGEIKVLPPIEIVFPESSAKLFDHESKWDEDSPAYQAMSDCFVSEEKEADLIKKISDITLACWKIFDLRGYMRVDFRVDSEGNPYVLEFNANPCLEQESGLAAAAAAAGYNYQQLISHILTSAHYGL